MLRQDDIALAARIAEGDHEAENFLFSRFRERIDFLVKIRLTGKVPAEDRKDIVGDIHRAILVSLRKGLFKPETGKPLDAYIAGISSNIIGQYFRKLGKEVITEDIAVQYNIENPGNILSDIIDTERRERVRACLHRIKPKYLEILILRYYEEKSIDEIAGQLNLERRRVSERINYAFKLLLKECKKDKYFQ
jgi:RNA polymerase sigma-70 factor, ECF subfamily